VAQTCPERHFEGPSPSRQRHTPALEREQQLVWAFDFVFSLQEFFTPWFARALGALIDRVANSETVIAGSFGAGARELVTCLAGLEELAFERSVLAPQFALTDDARKLSSLLVSRARASTSNGVFFLSR
jgi:hypothetical protein